MGISSILPVFFVLCIYCPYPLRNPKQEGGQPSLTWDKKTSAVRIFANYVYLQRFLSKSETSIRKQKFTYPEEETKHSSSSLTGWALTGWASLAGICSIQKLFWEDLIRMQKTMQIHRGQVSKPFPRQSQLKLGPVGTAYWPLNKCLSTFPGVSDFLWIVLGWTCYEHEFKKKKRFSRFKLKLEFMVNFQAVTEPDHHC